MGAYYRLRCMCDFDYIELFRRYQIVQCSRTFQFDVCFCFRVQCSNRTYTVKR